MKKYLLFIILTLFTVINSQAAMIFEDSQVMIFEDSQVLTLYADQEYEVFNVTDNGGEAFRITDEGGQDFNVKI